MQVHVNAYAKRKMRIGLKVVFAFLLFTSFNTGYIFAQNSDAKITVSYDVKKKQYPRFFSGDIKKLTPLEKAQIRIVELEEHHEIVTDKNNDVTETITHLKSTGEPEWLKKPAKTVIDKNGVKMYDAKGKLVNNVPAIEKEKLDFEIDKDYRTDNVQLTGPEFKELGVNEIADLEKSGHAVSKTAKGTVVAKKDSLMHLYNAGNKHMRQEYMTVMRLNML